MDSNNHPKLVTDWSVCLQEIEKVYQSWLWLPHLLECGKRKIKPYVVAPRWTISSTRTAIRASQENREIWDQCEKTRGIHGEAGWARKYWRHVKQKNTLNYTSNADGALLWATEAQVQGGFFKAVRDFWMNLITTSCRDVTVMMDMMVRNEGESSPNERTF